MLYNDYASQGQWMGVRIKELMTVCKKKITKFSEEIGVERTTLRRIIEGERIAENEQLSRIADGLGISVERLKQSDIKKDFNELKGLLESRTLLQRSFSIASDLLSKAIGASEKAEMNRLVGVSLQYMKRLEDAQKHFDKAMELSLQTENVPLICRVLVNSTNNAFHFGQYDKVCDLVDAYKEYAINKVETMGRFYQLKGMCYQVKDDVLNARYEYEKAMSCYEEVEDFANYGAVVVNLAKIEFENGNLQKAKDNLLIAQSKLENNKEYLVVANRKLAKTYIALNELEKAESLIDFTITEIIKFGVDNSDDYAKLLYMKAGIKNDVVSAEMAINISGIDSKLKKSIANFLVKSFMKEGNLNKVEKYYTIMIENIEDKFVDYSKI